MKKIIKIGVLFGGPSKEREISLITGQAILNNLDKKKYLPIAIEMGKDHKFYLLKGKKRLLLNLYDLKKKVDIVFIALHGTFGEDGGVQGMLEALGIKYTGSNVLASAVAMNKVFSGQIYEMNNLDTPKFEHIKKEGWKKYKTEVLGAIKNNIGFPCVVKPVDQGSAVGVSIVKNENDLPKVLDKTFKEFNWLMVQKFITGEEATCGILEKNGELVALPPTHILPVLGQFYDYKAKYAKGGSKHVCPADFEPQINSKMQEIAKKAHKALRCSGMSRSDFFVENKTNKLWLIETNTIPGMTSTSLLPEAARAMGISFSKMLEMIIESSQ